MSESNICNSLFNSTPIGVGVSDANGNIIDANMAFCEMTGYCLEEIRHQTIKSLSHPNDMIRELEFHKMLFDGTIDSFKIEKRLIGKNNKITEIRLTTSAIKDKNNQIIKIYGFAKDITVENNLKRKQENYNSAMAQQEKMAMMGEMIGVIAHQWKQPLNSLYVELQTLGLITFDRATLESSVENCLKQIRQMNNTIDDFMNFYKKDKERKIFDIEKTINSTLSLVMPRIQSNFISLNVSSEQTPQLVCGYENELKQAILNILNNAIDALLHNKILNPAIDITIRQFGDKTEIAIGDNAGGITSDNIETIFEPDYSTKGENGTGLGLSICKSIIEDSMNGVLCVENTKDGAQFRITL